MTAIKSVPQRRSRAGILALYSQIPLWSLLRDLEHVISDRDKNKLTFCFLPWFQNQVFPQDIKLDPGTTHEIALWSIPKGEDFPPLGFFVDLDIQLTSFLDNPTSHECIKLLGHSKGWLTILEPAPDSVPPYCYCRVFPWYFEKEDWSCSWLWVDVKILHCVFQWILNTNKPTGGWSQREELCLLRTRIVRAITGSACFTIIWTRASRTRCWKWRMVRRARSWHCLMTWTGWEPDNQRLSMWGARVGANCFIWKPLLPYCIRHFKPLSSIVSSRLGLHEESQ